MSNRVRSAIRALASDSLQAAPTALWRTLAPKSCVGVCYHLVAETRPAHLKHYAVLDPAAFEADLDYLDRNNGFIDYEALVERRSKTAAQRDNRALLTFDDGFSECATVIAPILKRRAISGVFFLITDLIDNKVLFRENKAALCIDKVLTTPVDVVEAISAELGLTTVRAPATSQTLFGHLSKSALELADLEASDPRSWPLIDWLLTKASARTDVLDALCDRLGVEPGAYLAAAKPYLTREQILELHADGFTIGAHSCTHRQLSDLTPEEAEREIVESCRAVQAITGQEKVPFAFPYFGGWLDRTWLADLRERHPFIGLFFDTDGLREDAPFIVQRVFGERFTRDSTLELILRRAWGRPAAWKRRVS